MATQERWERTDFLNTPLYASLREHKDRTFEILTDDGESGLGEFWPTLIGYWDKISHW